MDFERVAMDFERVAMDFERVALNFSCVPFGLMRSLYRSMRLPISLTPAGV